MASDIAAPSDGIISAISFKWNGAIEMTRDIDVYMTHTLKSDFEASNDWVSISTMTLVFAGELKLEQILGWYTLVLETAFVYNNQDNLIIAVDDNTDNYVSYIQDFYCDTVDTQRALIVSNDVDVDPANPYSMALSNFVPNLKITIGMGNQYLCHWCYSVTFIVCKLCQYQE